MYCVQLLPQHFAVKTAFSHSLDARLLSFYSPIAHFPFDFCRQTLCFSPKFAFYLSLSLSVHPSISQICGSLPFAHMCNTKACTFSLTIKRPDIFLRTNVLFSQAQYTSANTHTKILNSNGKENFPSNFAHSRAFRSTLFQSLDIIHPYIRKAFTLCLSTNFVCLPLFSPIIWQNST